MSKTEKILNAKAIKAKAQREVAEELIKDLTADYKRKLRQRADAAQMVANFDRELELLELEIDQKLEARV